MANDLIVGIDKPSFYKFHRNYVDLKWGTYERNTLDPITYSTTIDGYNDTFQINEVLLNGGINEISFTFDYTDIIDGYGKANGLTYDEVVDLLIDGYSGIIVDGYNITLIREVTFDMANRVIVALDGTYYKEIRRSVDSSGIVESRTNPSVNFTVDTNQDGVGFREETISGILTEGSHAVKIDVFVDLPEGYGILDGYGIRTFVVDDTNPIINILSPTAFNAVDPTTIGQGLPFLQYTIDGIENPIDIPLVNVDIEVDDGYQTFLPDDGSDGYADGSGFMDGYGDRGRIPSRTYLNLRPGNYKMRIIVQDSAGNMGSTFRRFAFNMPLEFSTAPEDIWVGSDLLGKNQSDSTIEELMIRNVEVTDADATLDYVLGLRDLAFRTKETDRLVFTPEEEQRIRQLSIDLLTASGDLPSTLTSAERESRISTKNAQIESYLNDTNRILLLSDFNIEIEPTDGASLLKKDFNPVLMTTQSLNELNVTILQKKSEDIDRDLLRDLFNKIIPAHTKVLINYEEVPE